MSQLEAIVAEELNTVLATNERRLGSALSTNCLLDEDERCILPVPGAVRFNGTLVAQNVMAPSGDHIPQSSLTLHAVEEA
mmetsp:Transcript_58780/g.122032  ORF Transcript_58780/g.122032 Transcript_58780/m.122032 type:complete len:80 (+) Transcript_58780:754-993(+)